MRNRNFNLLVIANIVLGMSMPMLILLGGLAGASLAPTPLLATTVMSIQMLAGIVTATPLSLLMSAIGRKHGFVCVGLLTSAGGVVGSLAMSNQHFVLLCISHFILGAALIGVNFFRFAASESVSDRSKANALSLVLASGLIAALLGPTVFDLSKDAWAGFEYAGAYLAIGALGLVGCLPVLAMKNQLNINTSNAVVKSLATSRSLHQILLDRKVVIAIVGAAISQAIMVMLMVPTPLAMIDSGHLTEHASDVIRWHVVAMFAPGLMTGWLIRLLGVMVVIRIGMGLLALSAIVALAGMGLSQFYLSLILLGVGWNFGFIGSTHLLQQSITENEKGFMQGLNDTVLAVCGSAASIAGGAIYMGVGWAFVSYIAIAILIISIVLWLVFQKRRIKVFSI